MPAAQACPSAELFASPHYILPCTYDGGVSCSGCQRCHGLIVIEVPEDQLHGDLVDPYDTEDA